MLTDEQLQQIMPGLPAPKKAALLPFLRAAMAEFAIESPARAAAFLAQLAHESGQFRFMEEIWGPTSAQQRYEPASTLATTLGNSEAGDGKRFKGRGPIQITGRANYRRFGDLLGTDLVADPARAALPELAFRIAGLFWSKKGLNEIADHATEEAFREITRRINGGFNGFDDRRQYYVRATVVLGVAVAPATRGLEPDAARWSDEPAFDRGYEAIAIQRGERPRRTTRRKPAGGTRRTASKSKRSSDNSKARPRKTSRTGKAKRSRR